MTEYLAEITSPPVAEYFRGNGISTGEGANPFALAPYVSGNKERGIRNYGMNDSPLTYGELEYDGNGLTSPHANGEIWSAVNYDIFTALAKGSNRIKLVDNSYLSLNQPIFEQLLELIDEARMLNDGETGLRISR